MRSARTGRPSRLTLRGATLRLAVRDCPLQRGSTPWIPSNTPRPGRPRWPSCAPPAGAHERSRRSCGRTSWPCRVGRSGLPGRRRLRRDGHPGDRERDPGRPGPRLPRRARPGQDPAGATTRRAARSVAADRRRRELNDDPTAPISPLRARSSSARATRPGSSGSRATGATPRSSPRRTSRSPT